MKRFVSRYQLLLAISMLFNAYFILNYVRSGSTEETSRDVKFATLTLTKSLSKNDSTPDINVTAERNEFKSLNSSNWKGSYPTQTVSATPNNFKEPEEVQSARYMLAVLIVTAPAYLDRRDIIRNTWKNGYEHRKFYVKFVIGTKNLQEHVISELQDENSVHDDLLLLPDVEDYYQNLGHKVLAGLVWFDQNVNYSYLLKCDDDTFVLLDKIEDDLRQRNHSQGLYWGYFIGNAKPFKEGQFAEPNWKLCDTYLQYAFGGGYVLSADIVHRVAANADAMIVYNNEDVSVGVWTVIYDIERRHDERFDTGVRETKCKNIFLITHKQFVKDIAKKHRLYQKSGKICKPN